MRKIAVTYENGQIFQHFGHTQAFKIYDVEDGRVARSAVVGSEGSGHGARAGVLKELGVDALICGGFGGGARSALDQAGITLYGGVSGDADAAVTALLEGGLDFSSEATCDHHGHEHHGDCHGHDHGHTCGGHCGE